MDAGIADTINRRTVAFMVAKLDALHAQALMITPAAKPWWFDHPADLMLRDDAATRPDRAWYVGHLASGIPGSAWDGCPADCDWDNLFQHFRDEIIARRDPKTPPARTGATHPCGVV